MAHDQQLWPEPGQMHAYLDRWHAYLEAAEARLDEEIKAHQEDVKRYVGMVDELEHRLRTQAAPLESAIAGLNQELAHARNHIAALERVQQDSLERLAAILETSPNARGATLTAMVGNAVLVIEESKKMIRENL